MSDKLPEKNGFCLLITTDAGFRWLTQPYPDKAQAGRVASGWLRENNDTRSVEIVPSFVVQE